LGAGAQKVIGIPLPHEFIKEHGSEVITYYIYHNKIPNLCFCPTNHSSKRNDSNFGMVAKVRTPTIN